MRHPTVLAATLLSLLCACHQQATPAPAVAAAAPPPAPTPTDLVARGEYLVRTTGCNDCHTADYGMQGGNVDKAQWLLGSPVGFRGPWGTTYATNLRLRLADMDETQWLKHSAELRTRPIMPDFALRAMTEDDRRAIFHFIKSLGVAGQPAPTYLPPGQAPQPPYYDLVLPPPPAGAPAAAPAAPAAQPGSSPAQSGAGTASATG